MSEQLEPNTSDDVLELVATITEQRDQERLEKSLLTTLLELLAVNRVSLYQLVKGETGEEAMIVLEGGAELAINASRYGVCLSLADQNAFGRVLESGNEYVQQLPEEQEFQSVYPIMCSGRKCGLLEIISATYSEQDQRIVQALLKIYSNYLSLLLESETDTLTGLLNRRTFDQNIEKIVAGRAISDSAASGLNQSRQVRRSTSDEAPHWLAIIDIDHFKKVNDVFGHLYGDEVLVLLARIMRRVFRQRDKLFRFGGEEFVVVLDCTSLENAETVLERFRKACEDYDFPQIGRVTISIGFVGLSYGVVPSVMIGRADQALYYAKHKGRNQVCQYEVLVAEGKLASPQYSDDPELF